MSETPAPKETRLPEHTAFTEYSYRRMRRRYYLLGVLVFVFSTWLNVQMAKLPLHLALSNAAVSAVILTVFALFWSRHRIWYYFTPRAIHRGWRPLGKLPPNGFVATRGEVRTWGPTKWQGHPALKVNVRGRDVILCYPEEFKGSGEEKAAMEWLKAASRDYRRGGR